ncbi:MAG: hypothetical protein EP330_29990 [Deltaproteobacteria bacterium]|nr:MAG: hypothetical protein EP330_29990 [Deltaproteobacteria bacterium]
MDEMPNDYKTAGILMLVAGCINLILVGIWQRSFLCLCFPAWITALTALGEIAVGGMILSGSKVPQAKLVSIAGIVGGLLSLSMMAVGLEVFATITLGKPEVEEYLNS